MSSIQEAYTPIRVLNQFSTDWRIRARVTKKGEEKHWRNNKGEGVLMNIDLIDKEGTQIQATFFGERSVQVCTYSKRKQDIFVLQHGQVKLANKKFTSIKNDYCLTFDSSGDI